MKFNIGYKLFSSLRCTKKVLMKLFAFGALLIFLLCHESSRAQIVFTASAPKTIPLNQNFNITFTLENANGSNLKLPPLTDFTLLGGPSTLSSMQNINNSITQLASYTYVLRPVKLGTFKIGAASIQV